MLFLISVNDIASMMGSLVKYKTKHDTKIASKATMTIDEELQWDLDQLTCWTNQWQMKFNVDKCNEVLHIGNSNISIQYVMDGEQFSAVSKEMALGLTISIDLKLGQDCS